MDLILEAHLQIIINFIFIFYLDTFILIPIQLEGGISIQDTHVVNIVGSLLPVFLDENISVLM